MLCVGGIRVVDVVTLYRVPLIASVEVRKPTCNNTGLHCHSVSSPSVAVCRYMQAYV